MSTLVRNKAHVSERFHQQSPKLFRDWLRDGAYIKPQYGALSGHSLYPDPAPISRQLWSQVGSQIKTQLAPNGCADGNFLRNFIYRRDRYPLKPPIGIADDTCKQSKQEIGSSMPDI